MRLKSPSVWLKAFDVPLRPKSGPWPVPLNPELLLKPPEPRPWPVPLSWRQKLSLPDAPVPQKPKPPRPLAAEAPLAPEAPEPLRRLSLMRLVTMGPDAPVALVVLVLVRRVAALPTVVADVSAVAVSVGVGVGVRVRPRWTCTDSPKLSSCKRFLPCASSNPLPAAVKHCTLRADS